MKQPPVQSIQPRPPSKPSAPARSPTVKSPVWRNQGEETTAQLSRLLRGKLPR
jgi:hypothetical protein